MRESTIQMKLNYSKELSNIRLQISTAEENRNKKQFVFSEKKANFNPIIDVRFFNVTDGLDEA